MAGGAGAASVQRGPFGRDSALPFLEHRVSEQTARLHPAEPHSALGRELRRLRQAERRAECHAVRFRGVREGRPGRSQAETRRQLGGGQFHENGGDRAAIQRRQSAVSTRADQKNDRRADDGKR